MPTINKRKVVHFAIILYLLTHGKRMTNFENISILLELMKVKHCPKKHWCDNSSWGMPKVLHHNSHASY